MCNTLAADLIYTGMKGSMWTGYARYTLYQSGFASLFLLKMFIIVYYKRLLLKAPYWNIQAKFRFLFMCMWNCDGRASGPTSSASHGTEEETIMTTIRPTHV